MLDKSTVFSKRAKRNDAVKTRDALTDNEEDMNTIIQVNVDERVSRFTKKNSLQEL